MESQIFWFVATVTCILAIGFAVRHRRSAVDGNESFFASLAKGQEKDNWLTCAVVWAVGLAGQTDFTSSLQLLGSAVLAWTAWRTLRRVALLPESPIG